MHRQLDMKPEGPRLDARPSPSLRERAREDARSPRSLGSRLDECLRKLRDYRYLEFALDSKTCSLPSAKG